MTQLIWNLYHPDNCAYAHMTLHPRFSGVLNLWSRRDFERLPYYASDFVTGRKRKRVGGGGIKGRKTLVWLSHKMMHCWFYDAFYKFRCLAWFVSRQIGIFIKFFPWLTVLFLFVWTTWLKYQFCLYYIGSSLKCAQKSTWLIVVSPL